MDFSSYLFWDVDPDKLDFQKHGQYIFDRVVTRGNLKDWHELIKLYGKDQCRSYAIAMKNADAKTLNLLAVYFDKDPTEFRCYSRTQLMDQL